MHEIELKFGVPEERRGAVALAVGGRRVHLQAAYVDTVDRALAAAGLALRLRREGRQWVQTLKGASSDGMTRFEHNVPRPGTAAAVPELDTSLHAGTPAGERLAAVLAAAAEPRLIVHFRTDIWRLARTLRAARGQVELAFDTGVIVAGSRKLPVCELEIELVSGSPVAVLTTARRWVRLHGLWLDTRSKAERGDRLSREPGSKETMRDAGCHQPPLHKEMPLEAARQQALQDCWRQIGANASELAVGSTDPEHLHQLRVGLRRLRSLQRLLAAPGAERPGWVLQLAELFRRLGALRDRDALAAAVLPRLRVAMALAAPGTLTSIDPAAWLASPHPADESPQQLLCSELAQGLLLELLSVMAVPSNEGAAAPSLEPTVSRRLQRWHARVLAGIERFAALDAAGRHELRKRVKRLRYAAEWVAPLYPRGAATRYLAALRDVQACLGDINDLTVASELIAAHADGGANAAFALGWLAGQREALLMAAPARLGGMAGVDRFWPSGKGPGSAKKGRKSGRRGKKSRAQAKPAV